MILYLAGPISSDLAKYKDKFNAAESYLTCWKGHVVLNPAINPLGLKYSDYINIDMAMLNAADGIVMLRGWKDSPGARNEFKYAVEKGKKYFFGIESVPFAEDVESD